MAVTLAEQKLKVAQTQLEAAKDKASAILAKAEAEADVIKFDNAAEAAGLAAQVAAFDGDGAALARNMLLGKLAPVVPHDPGQLGRSAHGPVPPVHPAARSATVVTAAERWHGRGADNPSARPGSADRPVVSPASRSPVASSEENQP